MTWLTSACMLLAPGLAPLRAQLDRPPLMRVLDLDVAETAEAAWGGAPTAVTLLAVNSRADTINRAVRSTSVRVRVNGSETVLECGNYRLPITFAGVQIDCAVTGALLANAQAKPWGLRKDARLRLWPAGSPLLAPASYTYPVLARWFSTDTQMANEPAFVDGEDSPGSRTVGYHYGLDIGGADGLTEVVSATAGRVVVRGATALPDYQGSPYIEVNYDGVVVLDQRGWFHWYFHLASIDQAVELGKPIRLGQRIGAIGKEGRAGCWAHLHYEIRGPQPSGEPGIVEGYAFLWEAYRNRFDPEIIAVARPHSSAWAGDPVILEGSRSWTKSGRIARYEWTLTGGSRARGPTVKRKYAKPGTYSEVLRVTDSRGNTAYDFAVVRVLERPGADEPPAIHAAFWPALDVRAGDPVTFLVRTIGTAAGHETWDFGDGSAPVAVVSDGCARPKAHDGYARTQHVFRKPGDYIARVERANERGEKAVAHLWIPVR